MPLSGLKILDIGCGGGLMCEPLARLGAEVTGIDAVEKNIKSGRAESDGSLKVSASIEKEADVIEKKAEDGQKLNKKQIKKIPKDMADIAKSCVTMVERQEDGEDLIRDLIYKLEQILDQIQSGRLKYIG